MGYGFSFTYPEFPCFFKLLQLACHVAYMFVSLKCSPTPCIQLPHSILSCNHNTHTHIISVRSPVTSTKAQNHVPGSPNLCHCCLQRIHLASLGRRVLLIWATVNPKPLFLDPRHRSNAPTSCSVRWLTAALQQLQCLKSEPFCVLGVLQNCC